MASTMGRKSKYRRFISLRGAFHHAGMSITSLGLAWFVLLRMIVVNRCYLRSGTNSPEFSLSRALTVAQV
jgi:hypothetical protein